MTAKWKYPTAFSAWGSEERYAIARVLGSEQFTIGPEVGAFEREFADYHKRAFGIMVNSGSSANLIATAALEQLGYIRRGQTAIVPAIAWSTTYAPIVQHGLKLSLMDVDDSWNANLYSNTFDPPKDTGLLVACSILGNPAPLAELASAASTLGVPMLEDNCESLGAWTDQEVMTGRVGTLSTFSFYYSHQISAIEGGMILTDVEELAQACRMLRAHGWTRDVKPPETFDEEYDFRAFGYNVRPLELHAAVAREQLRKLPTFIAKRTENLAYFEQRASSLIIADRLLLQQPTSLRTSPFGIAFEVPGYGNRARVVAALRERGIDARLPTGGSFRKHAYGAPYAGQETPRADIVHDWGLFLGNAPWPIPELIDEAVSTIEGVFL